MKATSIYGLVWSAAIVVAVAALTAPAAGAAPFSVQLNGADGTEQALPDVQKAQIDDIVWDVVEYDRIPEGSPPGLQEARRQGFKVYGPGKPHYGNATLGVPPGEDSKQLNRWFEETRAGKVARTSATITFLADNDTTSRSITLNDCVPTLFVEAAGDATGTANGLDTLTVSIGSMTFSEDSQPGPLPQKAWVEATIVSDDPASKATEVFNSWSGGEPTLVLVGLLTGARLHTSTPGHKTVSPLVLTRSREKLGPLTGTKGDFIYRWINDALNGNPWRRSVTITENGGHGAAGRSYVYNDGFPVRYSIQGFDSKSSALLTESITCKYETVKYA